MGSAREGLRLSATICPGRAGHSSRAVHEAYAKGAFVIVPPLDEYESIAQRKVQGTGGFRKIRMKLAGRGKSAGARVVFFHVKDHAVFFLFLLNIKAN